VQSADDDRNIADTPQSAEHVACAQPLPRGQRHPDESGRFPPYGIGDCDDRLILRHAQKCDLMPMLAQPRSEESRAQRGYGPFVFRIQFQEQDAHGERLRASAAGRNAYSGLLSTSSSAR
jgi:hypothetical protein